MKNSCCRECQGPAEFIDKEVFNNLVVSKKAFVNKQLNTGLPDLQQFFNSFLSESCDSRLNFHCKRHIGEHEVQSISGFLRSNNNEDVLNDDLTQRLEKALCDLNQAYFKIREIRKRQHLKLEAKKALKAMAVGGGLSPLSQAVYFQSLKDFTMFSAGKIEMMEQLSIALREAFMTFDLAIESLVHAPRQFQDKTQTSRLPQQNSDQLSSSKERSIFESSKPKQNPPAAKLFSLPSIDNQIREKQEEAEKLKSIIEQSKVLSKVATHQDNLGDDHLQTTNTSLHVESEIVFFEDELPQRQKRDNRRVLPQEEAKAESDTEQDASRYLRKGEQPPLESKPNPPSSPRLLDKKPEHKKPESLFKEPLPPKKPQQKASPLSKAPTASQSVSQASTQERSDPSVQSQLEDKALRNSPSKLKLGEKRPLPNEASENDDQPPSKYQKASSQERKPMKAKPGEKPSLKVQIPKRDMKANEKESSKKKAEVSKLRVSEEEQQMAAPKSPQSPASDKSMKAPGSTQSIKSRQSPSLFLNDSRMPPEVSSPALPLSCLQETAGREEDPVLVLSKAVEKENVGHSEEERKLAQSQGESQAARRSPKVSEPREPPKPLISMKPPAPLRAKTEPEKLAPVSKKKAVNEKPPLSMVKDAAYNLRRSSRLQGLPPENNNKKQSSKARQTRSRSVSARKPSPAKKELASAAKKPQRDSSRARSLSRARSSSRAKASVSKNEAKQLSKVASSRERDTSNEEMKVDSMLNLPKLKKSQQIFKLSKHPEGVQFPQNPLDLLPLLDKLQPSPPSKVPKPAPIDPAILQAETDKLILRQEKKSDFIQQLPLFLGLQESSNEDRAIMCFRFLSRPDLVAYCIRTEGIYVASFAEMAEAQVRAQLKAALNPSSSFLAFKDFGKQYRGDPGLNIMAKNPKLGDFTMSSTEMIQTIYELSYFPQRLYFLALVGSEHGIYILQDHGQGTFSSLAVIQILPYKCFAPEFKISESSSIPSAYCVHQHKLFFALGGKLFFYKQPERQSEDELNTKVLFDLKSRFERITALRTRYSDNEKETQIYVGTSMGNVLIVGERTAYQMLKFKPFSAIPVNHIAFINPPGSEKDVFGFVFASSQLKELKIYLTHYHAIKKYSRDITGKVTPQKLPDQMLCETVQLNLKQSQVQSMMMLRRQNKILVASQSELAIVSLPVYYSRKEEEPPCRHSDRARFQQLKFGRIQKEGSLKQSVCQPISAQNFLCFDQNREYMDNIKRDRPDRERRSSERLVNSKDLAFGISCDNEIHFFR